MSNKSKGKGSRNPLREDTAHFLRHNTILSPESCLLSGSRCKRERSLEMKENRSAVTIAAMNCLWNPPPADNLMEFLEEPRDDIESFLKTPTKLSTGVSSLRKKAIQYIFEHVLNSPQRQDWKSKGVVSLIMDKLEMPEGSRGTVLSVLEASVAGEALSKAMSRRGRRKSIDPYSEEADFLCSIFENTDSSDTTVASIANLRRIGRVGLGAETISRSALRNFRVNSDVLDTSARNEENMGSADIDSTWCISRVSLYTQFLEQLRLGDLPLDHPDVISSPFTPKKLHGCLWIDQKHEKQRFGRGGKRQVRVARDSNGKMCPVGKGGTLKKKQASKTVKFPLEGRGNFIS